MTDVASETRAPSSIRVGIVDDQSLVREGLRTLLSNMTGIEVTLCASSGPDFMEQIGHAPIDVAIIDIRMPGQTGFALVRQLRALRPEIKSILLTTFDERGLIGEAVRCGAEGLLLKGVSPQELLAAIREVARGGLARIPAESTGSKRVMDLAGVAEPVALSPRECTILRLAAGGHSNKDIARALVLAEGTIKNHMTEILLKLDARDRTQAVLKAMAAGKI